MANNLHAPGSFASRGVEVFASGARTATPDTEEFDIGSQWQSLTLVVNTTAAGSSPSTVFKTEWVDRITGQVFGACSTAAVTGTGAIIMRISPHLTAAGTTIYKDAIHPLVRVTATHGNATTHTYQVSLIAA